MRWLLLTTLVCACAAQREYCLSGDEDPYLLFATKTAYTFANQGLNHRTHEVPGCVPIALWLVNRHGSTNPEPSEMDQIQTLPHIRDMVINNYRSGNYRKFNDRICSADLNLLGRWSTNGLNRSQAGNLTSEGYVMTQQLARAFRNKYPGLLTENQHDYMFKLANDERSKMSLRAFTEGIFRTQAEVLTMTQTYDDKLLKPYKECPAWQNNVGQNNDSLTQKYIFESKREYNEMLSNISQRLGFSYEVSKDAVFAMYQLCRYNKAWDVAAISPWCSVFTREDLKRLEYAEDLEAFYKYGYGSATNLKISCPLVKDMMSFFDRHVENAQPQQPRAQVYFTDAATLLLTVTAMGARRDHAPLTGDNYHSAAMQSRKWSSSSISPFNGNLAAALYKCAPGSKLYNDMYQVLFLENEKPMDIENCKLGLCDWSLVKNRFGLIASQCDSESCNSATAIKGLGLSLLVVMLSFVF